MCAHVHTTALGPSLPRASSPIAILPSPKSEASLVLAARPCSSLYCLYWLLVRMLEQTGPVTPASPAQRQSRVPRCSALPRIDALVTGSGRGSGSPRERQESQGSMSIRGASCVGSCLPPPPHPKIQVHSQTQKGDPEPGSSQMSLVKDLKRKSSWVWGVS